jgi:hypothetical protein
VPGAWPHLIDWVDHETCFAKHSHHPRAMRAIKEYFLVEFRLPSAQSIQALAGFLVPEC